jgi:hypothetical protein
MIYVPGEPRWSRKEEELGETSVYDFVYSNHIWTEQGANLCLHGKRQATNSQSHGKAMSFIK